MELRTLRLDAEGGEMTTQDDIKQGVFVCEAFLFRVGRVDLVEFLHVLHVLHG